MADRNSVFRYFLSDYFDNDVDKMADQLGFSKRDLVAWRDDEKIPKRNNVEYLLNSILTPEFKVIKEFFEFNSTLQILPQLKEMYSGHEDRSGIYAFYDAMVNLQYIGKANNLLDETYSAIRRNHDLIFPAGIKNQEIARYNVVRYISAYDVKIIKGFDYPKHVESLILRISKPIMNKQIGRLEAAYPKLNDVE
jgi:hypothetical protein